jgi:hypothetical protein
MPRVSASRARTFGTVMCTACSSALCDTSASNGLRPAAAFSWSAVRPMVCPSSRRSSSAEVRCITFRFVIL